MIMMAIDYSVAGERQLSPKRRFSSDWTPSTRKLFRTGRQYCKSRTPRVAHFYCVGATGGEPAPQETEQLFQQLAQKWRDETAFTSSVHDLILHPSYQEIIGLGRPVLPLILKSLQQTPEFWFWALQSITRVDPVPASHVGNVELMAADWIGWGKKSGII